MSNRTNRKNFNDAWLCCGGDAPQAYQPLYDDSFWQKQDLPHDWSIRQNFDETLPAGSEHAYLPNGIVWYRKHFSLKKVPGRKYLLEFEGVYRSPDVFVNGIHAGKRFNGFVGFELDITPFLQDGDNVIAVRADNSHEHSARWYTGTGINRNVWFHDVPETHFLRHGLLIRPDAASGKVELTGFTTAPVPVDFTLYAPDGAELGHISARSGETAALTVHDPLRWSPETPVLYSCKAALADGSDVLTDRFGFRTVEFTPEQGFMLNGKKYDLQGMDLHEDLCGLGTASYADGIRRRYARLKAWGVNAIRLAHHPYAPAWYDLADEMGLLIFAEAFDKWTGQFNGWEAEFETTWERDLAEFVTGCRNHPSIFIWSVGNEVGEHQIRGDEEFGVPRYRKMRDTVKQLDPSRKITAALFPARAGGVYSYGRTADFARETEIAEMAHEMDVVSVNYMGQYFALDHAHYPDMIFLVSEENTTNGASKWRIYDHAYGCGSFFWGGFDYLGEAKWPHKNWFRGFVDRAGFRKPVSYQLEAMWKKEPMAKLAVCRRSGNESERWNEVQLDWEELETNWNRPENERSRVVMYSNMPRVRLLLNGRVAAERTLSYQDCCRANCELPYEPGTLRLEALDEAGNVVAADELVTAGKADALDLKLENFTPGRNGLIHAEITATSGGIPCPAENIVHLRLQGPAQLLGVTNGDTTSPQRHWSSSVYLAHGRALAVFRITGTGKIRITVVSGKLSAEKSLDIPENKGQEK